MGMKKLRYSRMLVWASFSVVILMWAAPSVEGGARSGLNTSLLSDTSGEIEEIVLQYSSLLSEEVLPTYRDLIGQLEQDTTIYIVCEEPSLAEKLGEIIEGWSIIDGDRIVISSIEKEITIWSRDRFFMKSGSSNGGMTTVLLPRIPENRDINRHNDKEVPVVLSLFYGKSMDIQQSALFFEGGNIVTNESRLFTSYSTLLMQGGKSEKEIIELLEKEFGKEVLIVGSMSVPEPLWHIDMYLTPISDSLVLLGEPIIEKDGLSYGYEEGMLCGLEDTEALLAEYSSRDHIVSFLNGLKLQSYANVESQLIQEGFRVERIPITYDENGNIITYNNVLMETRNNKRIVFMPVYGVPRLDEIATDKYEELGFEVRPIDVSGIYKYDGALRCMTNVLVRRRSD